MNTLPHEVVEAFTSAATTALQELAQLEIVVEQVDDEAGLSTRGSLVIATIALVREPPGSLSLVLAGETAAALASRYLPPGTALTAELIDDVAGEFVNVIAGQAKTMLKGTPYHFLLSTPAVERVAAWDDHKMPNPDITARLHCEIGVVVLCVCLLG